MFKGFKEFFNSNFKGVFYSDAEHFFSNLFGGIKNYPYFCTKK